MRFDNIGNAAVGQAGRANAATFADRAEYRTFSDLCCGQPIGDRVHRTGNVAAQDGGRVALTLLVGLAVGDSDRNPASVCSIWDTSNATSSERRNAPAKPSSSKARSRRAISPSPVRAMAMIRAAVAGAFFAAAVPLVRRMPRTVAFTRSSSGGTSSPASL